MKKVRPGLYIGGIEDARSCLWGSGRGVTHVLSLEQVRPLKKKRRNAPLRKLQQLLLEIKADRKNDGDEVPEKLTDAKPVVKEVLLRDVVEEDLVGVLPSCLDFIEQGRQNGVVLVHCGAGISRSAAVVAAYLMREEGRSSEDALASLRECRPEVCPNDGFMQQLKAFEHMHKVGETTAAVSCGGKRPFVNELDECEPKYELIKTC